MEHILGNRKKGEHPLLLVLINFNTKQALERVHFNLEEEGAYKLQAVEWKSLYDPRTRSFSFADTKENFLCHLNIWSPYLNLHV